MKLSFLLVCSLFCFLVSAQVKIDPAYSIVTKNREFQNSSYFCPDFSNKDSIFIKEKSTGKICQLTWCRWKFILESQEVIIKDMEQVANFLLLLKPKDKIIMEKIVLLPDCFAPPEQIIIGVI